MKVLNSIKSWAKGKLVLMFTCIAKVYCQRSYMSDINYPDILSDEYY